MNTHKTHYKLDIKRFFLHTNASKSALILLFLAFSFSIAQAATKTWVPINGGAWTTASNWAPAGVPATDDDVIINSD